MGQFIDITGLRFGKLIVIERSFPNVDGSAMGDANVIAVTKWLLKVIF